LEFEKSDSLARTPNIFI